MAAGVYLHIPFCKSRCSYCDFATDVYRNDQLVDRYVAALCKEIETFDCKGGNTTGKECSPNAFITLPAGRVSACRDELYVAIDTIYFGGGTPSLLKPEQVELILRAVRETFSTEADSEITMEMNPATVTPDSLSAYKTLGVNRASFGVQTFNDRALKL